MVCSKISTATITHTAVVSYSKANGIGTIGMIYTDSIYTPIRNVNYTVIPARVGNSMEQMLQGSFIGYNSVVPTGKQLNVDHSKAKYVLLPVWMLHTKYKDKTYVFAMNGQSGKMTGTFPICPKRTLGWFAGIWAGSAALLTLLLSLFL